MGGGERGKKVSGPTLLEPLNTCLEISPIGVSGGTDHYFLVNRNVSRSATQRQCPSHLHPQSQRPSKHRLEEQHIMIRTAVHEILHALGVTDTFWGTVGSTTSSMPGGRAAVIHANSRGKVVTIMNTPKVQQFARSYSTTIVQLQRALRLRTVVARALLGGTSRNVRLTRK